MEFVYRKSIFNFKGVIVTSSYKYQEVPRDDRLCMLCMIHIQYRNSIIYIYPMCFNSVTQVLHFTLCHNWNHVAVLSDTQGHGHAGRVSSSWELRELVAWLLKFNIEQPSIVLNPCLHVVFFSERKLTSIIAYTVLTNNVLICGVPLFCNTETVSSFGETVMNSSFSASDFASQTVCFARRLASM